MDKIKQFLGAVIGYGVIMIIILAIITVIAVFGSSIMGLFGFQYKSIGSIIIFFTATAIIGIPIEIFVKALSKALVSLEKITIKLAKILYIMLDTLSTAITMALVDSFMDSVSATEISILIVAFLLAVISAKDMKE